MRYLCMKNNSFMKFRIMTASLLLLLLSCSQKPNTSSSVLQAPTSLTAVLEGQSSVRLSWTDACEGETGYYVFNRRQSINSPAATLPPDSGEYLFEGLEEGEYVFGVQAFGKDGAMSRITISEKISVPGGSGEEDDPNPVAPVVFNWTEVGGLDLPAGVKVFQTTATLNGRPLNAWYAVADCKGDVRFRVLYPGARNFKTLDVQAEADPKCLVLVNGGIFGSSSGKPNGFALCDGVQTPWFRVEDDNWDVDRQYWGAEIDGKSDGQLHTVSRGLFGVDASGVPGVYWSYTPGYGTVYVYDQPIPSVEGEAVRPGGTPTYPCPKASWEPYNAITCGPVLLQKGKCPINDRKTAKGYWQTNYEMWKSDIFGVDELHDRTAVGYLEDGRIILLVADGRTDDSKGATTLEMAAIMKGLGCVGALNLDGGGSTGIWAKGGGHLNDLTADTNRPLLTTIGFFSK